MVGETFEFKLLITFEYSQNYLKNIIAIIARLFLICCLKGFKNLTPL